MCPHMPKGSYGPRVQEEPKALPFFDPTSQEWVHDTDGVRVAWALIERLVAVPDTDVFARAQFLNGRHGGARDVDGVPAGLAGDQIANVGNFRSCVNLSEEARG